MVLDIFTGLRLVVKRRSISIDSAIFRCHWFLTSTLLGMFSFIITACQYVGRPIECHSANKLPDSMLNSYCWVQSTFTVPSACNQQVGLEVPYPCIDNARGRETKLFAYYQWVGIVLFIQGLLFHLPFYLWKVWENGLIKAITGGLRVAVLSDQERVKKRDIVVEYIQQHLGCHKRYAFKYFLCELICLVNLLGQLWATNKFFDGQFLRYGLDVINYTYSSLSSSGHNQLPMQKLNANITTTPPFPRVQQQQPKQATVVDPMTYIFPRITKCTYYDFGSSGDIQKHDALCLLPLNIINEKIYIALWFWFLVLALLTMLVLVYRLFAILSTNVRCQGLISRCKLSNELDIKIICRHCDVGDWFLFYMVAENLDPLIMREIVASVANKIREHLELKRRRSSLEEPHLVLKEDEAALFGCGWRSSSQDTMTLADAEQSPSSCRDTEQVPLFRKGKLGKRFYNKRQWSSDLGSAELRQQLFAGARQPATNPDHHLPRYQSPDSYRHEIIERQPSGECQELAVSAPPASEMSPVRRRQVYDDYSDDVSQAAPSSSFVMEMQPIATARHHLHLPAQLGISSSTSASNTATSAGAVQRRRFAFRKPAFALVFA